MAGPEFPHPRPTAIQLDDLVRGYEQITGDPVRRQPKRNFIAACYRVHGDDFLPLVREIYTCTGTATNLLGEIRSLAPRSSPEEPVVDSVELVASNPPVSAVKPSAVRQTEWPSLADAISAWCGCREEELRPDVLYCAVHRPEFGSFPTRRYDRRPSNPAAARFFAATTDQTKRA